MQSNKPEAELRPLARERIANGELPCEPAFRIWGSYGTEQQCSLCREPIQRNEIEYEVERTVTGHEHLVFHMLCLSIWQLECASHSPARSPF
jgi:hypothetical protein